MSTSQLQDAFTLTPPPVPAPAAPNSKEPADPALFEEIKLDFPITPGPCGPTWESIRQNYPGEPAWWRDAKFGVFVHWGPQASGMSGDWYARKLYMEGTEPYNNHLKNFGHPSEVGYKDVLNQWKAAKWGPKDLTQKFHDAGMRFMMVVGVHHDNFDLWHSRYQPWNSLNIGPKRDMIGEWQREAKKHDMRFGITFHHEYTWWWWATAYEADKAGPKAGVPYDAHLTLADGAGLWWEGYDPRLLYTLDLREYRDVAFIPHTRKGIFQDHIDYGKWYATWWATRIQDAVEQYDPDFFYTDGNAAGPFCGVKSGSGLKADAGPRVVADFYNRAHKNHGKIDTIAFIKWVPGNPAIGITRENTFPNEIVSNVMWIGENPIGDWYYAPGYHYDAIMLVRSLLEYASRDGHYACAVPLTPAGDLEPACIQMLTDMGAWMKINGEGIYGSRAWKVFGEGDLVTDPTKPDAAPKLRNMPQGKLEKRHADFQYMPNDFRFTQGKDGSIYVWCMKAPLPGEHVIIKSLGTESKLLEKKIASVSVLGSTAQVPWSQEAAGLVVTIPDDLKCKYAAGVAVKLAE